MNNVFVYCEVEGTTVAEVSQELLTKGRSSLTSRAWNSMPSWLVPASRVR